MRPCGYRATKTLAGWHLLAFATALAISVIIFCFYSRYASLSPSVNKSETLLPGAICGSLPNYSTGLVAEQKVYRVLASGESILLIGSSEFGIPYSPSIPYTFFPETLKVPLLALGHAGNQCFAIYAQLVCTNAINPGSKVAIILSPSWFGKPYSEGTSLESFIEMVPERFLYHAYTDKALPEEYKNYLFNYVVRNYENFQAPNEIVTCIYGNYSSLCKRSLGNSFKYGISFMQNSTALAFRKYINGETLILDWHLNNNRPAAPAKLATGMAPAWNDLYKASIADQYKVSASNRFGIYDAYYNAYLKGRECSKLEPVADSINQEMKDLGMLLKYLQHKKAKPVFFMQTLNPYVYCDLYAMSPVIAKVSGMVTSAGFEYKNFWQPDSNKYQIGILRDKMHFGDYAWYKIDSLLYARFTSKK